MTRHVAIPVEIARELARQAEVRLESLLAMGTAADARATTLCGIFGGASVALGAAVLAYLGTDHPSAWLLVSGSVTAVVLFVAAMLAAVAAAPRDFWIVGGMPDALREWAWESNGGRWYSEAEMLDATAKRLGKLIERDAELLEAGSRRIRRSLWVAFAAILLGVSIYLAGFLA